jgi:hypothetical protein
MLCSSCDSIVLDVSQQDAETEIRRYANVFDLKEMAPQCDFCDIVYDSARWIRDEEKKSTDSTLGRTPHEVALEQSPILVYHNSMCGAHNVT